MRMTLPLALAALVATAGIPSGLQAQDPAPVAVQLPTGAYLVAIQPTDSLPTEMAGEWRIVFESGGTYRMLRDNGVVVLGTYRAEGERLILVDTSGDMACLDAPPATYLWKTGPDGTLTLSAVEDSCTGRQRLTTLRALVRAKKE